MDPSWQSIGEKDCAILDSDAAVLKLESLPSRCLRCIPQFTSLQRWMEISVEVAADQELQNLHAMAQVLCGCVREVHIMSESRASDMQCVCEGACLGSVVSAHFSSRDCVRVYCCSQQYACLDCVARAP